MTHYEIMAKKNHPEFRYRVGDTVLFKYAPTKPGDRRTRFARTLEWHVGTVAKVIPPGADAWYHVSKKRRAGMRKPPSVSPAMRYLVQPADGKPLVLASWYSLRPSYSILALHDKLVKMAWRIVERDVIPTTQQPVEVRP